MPDESTGKSSRSCPDYPACG